MTEQIPNENEKLILDEVSEYLRTIREGTGFGRIVLEIHKGELEDVAITIFRKPKLEISRKNGKHAPQLERREH